MRIVLNCRKSFTEPWKFMKSKNWTVKGGKEWLVFLMCKVKKIWLRLKPSKMVKPKLTWLKSNLTKTRSGLTRVNLRKLRKYQRIWGNICIISKLRKLNTSIVWCPYFSLSVTWDCKNFKKTCLWARKWIEISVFRWWLDHF